MLDRLKICGLAENLTAPAANTYISYILDDTRKGAKQDKAEIYIESEDGKYSNGFTFCESKSSHIALPCLEPAKNYTVTVKAYVTDEAGETLCHSGCAKFRTEADYRAFPAKWIENTQEEETISPAHAGFKSPEYESAHACPWVMLDLGKTEDADMIAVYGARPFDVPGQPDCPGLLFPIGFRIEIANTEDFSDKTLVFESPVPYGNPGNQPVFFPVKEKFRYLKFTAEELQQTASRGYAFALEQIEVYRGIENIAKGCKVTASDSVETEFLGKSKLTDGSTVWHTEGPAKQMRQPLFFRRFGIKKEVAHAYLYSSALGLYEAEINGKKVGKAFLAPEWTEYRVYTNVLCGEITDALKEDNVLKIQLADGWYAGRVAMANVMGERRLRGVYGDVRPKFWGCIVIEYSDGEIEKIGTDESFRTTVYGALISSDIYDGETYDSRLEVTADEAYDISDARFTNASRRALSVDLRSQVNEPIGIIETVKEKSRRYDSKGRLVLDFGKLIAGTAHFRMNVPEGRVVRFLYSSHLKDDGDCYFANYRGARPVDTYVSKGGISDYTPKYTYRGYRYINIIGLDSEELISAEGLCLSSVKESTGEYAFGEKYATVLAQNIDNTIKSNFMGVTTDVPDRDERLPWCMDGFEISKYFSDAYTFFLRGREERLCAIKPAGVRPGQTPDALRMYGSQCSIDQDLQYPLLSYQFFGNETMIKEDYERCVSYMRRLDNDFPDAVMHIDGIVDWLCGDMIDAEGYPEKGAQIGASEYQTCKYIDQLRMIIKMARLIKNEKDEKHFAERLALSRKNYREQFMTKDMHTISDTQTSYAMAICAGVFEKEDLPEVKKNFIASIKRYDDRLSCGVYVVDQYFKALWLIGEQELALKLAFQDRFPSFGYMAECGATAVWERWDTYMRERPQPQIKRRWQAPKDSFYTFVNEAGSAGISMNSFNHIEMCSAGKWLIEQVLGLKIDADSFAASKFTLCPPCCSLNSASGKYMTARGLLEVKWEREYDKWKLDITVPVGTELKLVLPCKEIEANGEKQKICAAVTPVPDTEEGEMRLVSDSFSKPAASCVLCAGHYVISAE